MRLTIHLKTQGNSIIPINYQHALQGIIYTALKYGDEKFADWLHSQGYSSEDENKKFKLFCFSGISFDSAYLLDEKKENFILRGSSYRPGYLRFSISSPKEEFILHLVNGLFRTGNQINLANNQFQVDRVFSRANPEPATEVIVKPLFSPIVMRSQKTKSFLTYDQPEIEEALKNNLCRKYRTLHGKEMKAEEMEIQFMPSLLQEKSPKTKLITFVTEKDGRRLEIKTKGNFVPLRIKAAREIIETALDCGIGEKNSSGFGFIDLLKV